MSVSQVLPLYGPQYEGESGGNTGGSSGNTDQTDWKSKYESLSAQIANGQYVAKEAYVGLQQKLEGAVNEKKTIQGNFDSITAKYALVEDNFNKAQGTIQELTGTISTKEKDIEALNSKLERHNLIFSKFPGLAQFEADGLLPVPQDNQKLEDLLSIFQTKIGSLTETARAEYGKGSTNEPAGKGAAKPPATSAAILAEAKGLQGLGKFAEYDQKMTEYYAALAKEGK